MLGPLNPYKGWFLRTLVSVFWHSLAHNRSQHRRGLRDSRWNMWRRRRGVKSCTGAHVHVYLVMCSWSWVKAWRRRSTISGENRPLLHFQKTWNILALWFYPMGGVLQFYSWMIDFHILASITESCLSDQTYLSLIMGLINGSYKHH